MNRRQFLSAIVPASVRLANAGYARITRITVAPIQGRFHKFVTMNAYDTAPKGHTYSNHLIRIQTNQGVEGVGVMGYRTPDDAFYQALRNLVGVDPSAIYELQDGRVAGRSQSFAGVLRTYPFLDGAMFDLIGKLTGKAAWRLIGDSVRDRVETYDGTLYFSDVWFSDRGVAAVVEEAVEAAKRGYRGIKLKLGRGWRWMESGADSIVVELHFGRSSAPPMGFARRATVRAAIRKIP